MLASLLKFQKRAAGVSRTINRRLTLLNTLTNPPLPRRQRGGGFLKSLAKSMVTGKSDLGEIIGWAGSGKSIKNYKKMRKNQVLHNRIAPKMDKLKKVSNNIARHAVRRATRNHPKMERLLNNQWSALSQSLTDMAFNKIKKKSIKVNC